MTSLLLSNKNSIPSRAKNTNQRSNNQTLRRDRKRTHLWLAMVSLLLLGKIVFVVTNISISDQSLGNAFGAMSAQQLLQPLQQTADRVSRQVEEFAKCLDKFNESRSPTDQSLWVDAGKLLGKYSEIAVARRKQATSGLQASKSASRNRQSLEGSRHRAGGEPEVV